METSHLLPTLALAIAFAFPVAAQHGHDPETAPGAHAHGAHTPEPTAALLGRLRAGGLVLFVRHERTDGTARDDADYALGDCSTQRNLSVAGIASTRRPSMSHTATPHDIDPRHSAGCACLACAAEPSPAPRPTLPSRPSCAPAPTTAPGATRRPASPGCARPTWPWSTPRSATSTSPVVSGAAWSPPNPTSEPGSDAAVLLGEAVREQDTAMKAWGPMRRPLADRIDAMTLLE